MMTQGFFKSPLWLDVRSLVFATFAFAGVGTASDAVPKQELLNPHAENLMHIEYMIRVFTLISYGLSIVVAITVLCRFIFWVKDRNKDKD